MAEIKVLMFGASRSGKTSILASMIAGRNLLNTYRLQLYPSDDSPESGFGKKIIEMKDLCDSKTHRDQPRMTALMGTQEVSEYKYELKCQDFPNAGLINIVFYDIPGEYVKQSNVTELRKLSEIAEKCQIIIVAVDTPALLWAYQNGQANQEFITAAESLQTIFSDLANGLDANLPENNKSLKSIIFAPIKCESYIEDNKFYSEISRAIGEAYKDVIDFAKQLRCKISIIPMQTIGGVKFNKYSEPDEMFVLSYGQGSVTPQFKKGKDYEVTDLDSYITRCEKIDSQRVRIARSGDIYRLRDGDILTPTANMPKYPYVFAPGHPLPYIWYKAIGIGFKQKNCERVMYEVIKLTIQQIAATGNYSITNLLEQRNDGFWGRLLRWILESMGLPFNSDQLKGLCRALQGMAHNGVFNNEIVLLNNIDPNHDSPLRIPS